MKKRTLLVSTAILLVAVMALATASYAWFTAGATVTAKGLNIKATAGSSLLINGEADRATDATWFGKEGNAGLNVSLNPATSYEGINFAQLKSGYSAIARDNYAAANGSTAFSADALEDASGTYRVSTYYTLKNDSSKNVKVNLTGITITPGANDIYNALRVAVVVGGSSKVVYALGSNGSSDGGTTIQVGKKTGSTWGLDDPSLTTTISSPIEITSSLSAGSTLDVYVVIWIEGQDKYCTTKNVVNVAADVSLAFGSVDLT